MTAIAKERRKKLQAKIDKKLGYKEYCDGDIEVRRAGPHGCGVFAARQFAPSELIMEVRGQLLRQSEYEGSLFVMEVDDQWFLEPAIPAAFINHSCNPNSELVQVGRYTMAMVAVCNIESGTEICFDYQWQAEEWIPRCRCGAPNCRGWVVAEDSVKKMKKIAKRAEGKTKPR